LTPDAGRNLAASAEAFAQHGRNRHARNIHSAVLLVDAAGWYF
jgi:hypothetical protein